ncbi:MAG: YtcA family [Planctomycetota bacterium]
MLRNAHGDRNESANEGRRARRSGSAAFAAAMPIGQPIYDFFGAYIPAWLPAFGLGFLGMIVLRGALVAIGLHDRMPAKVFVYLAATVLFSCIAWFMLLELN